MSAPQPVSDPDDPRLADYVRLREVSLRRHLETERGLFIAEGEKVIRRAVEAGHRPRSFLLTERWLPSLADVIGRSPDVPVYVVSPELAEAVTGFHVHRGALASMHRAEQTPISDVLHTRRIVVLEDIVDHANVGAVLRSAAGLGWQGALLSPRCADPLYRRSVKVSMGAVFALPWARLEDWEAAPELLAAAGLETVALTLAEDAVELGTYAAEVAARPRPLAILLGTEGSGLSQHWSASAARRARIEMRAGIDSLNVAAAAAIACFALAEATPP
jgi:tRNA G18 (ribose-2'-O)-methylase SpoU